MVIVRKGDYFYLKHSFRKGGRVVTREKYLGKKIPEDIERAERELREENQNALNQKLEGIRKRFQQEWKKTPESARQREKEEIAISFTYNTNAIEGSTITIEDAREIISDKVSPNKPLRDVRETEAHAKAFLGMLERKEKVSKKLLLEWHREIFGETKQDIAGQFRTFLVRIGGHLAPDWQDVEGLMAGLVRFVNSGGMNPVELAARAHYRFEKIHPFGDGNGRIGRLLMNHILWHSGYPMLIIEYRKRRSYYKALNRSEDGFVRYFLRRYLAVHGKRNA